MRCPPMTRSRSVCGRCGPNTPTRWARIPRPFVQSSASSARAARQAQPARHSGQGSCMVDCSCGYAARMFEQSLGGHRCRRHWGSPASLRTLCAQLCVTHLTKSQLEAYCRTHNNLGSVCGCRHPPASRGATCRVELQPSFRGGAITGWTDAGRPSRGCMGIGASLPLARNMENHEGAAHQALHVSELFVCGVSIACVCATIWLKA